MHRPLFYTAHQHQNFKNHIFSAIFCLKIVFVVLLHPKIESCIFNSGSIHDPDMVVLNCFTFPDIFPNILIALFTDNTYFSDLERVCLWSPVNQL